MKLRNCVICGTVGGWLNKLFEYAIDKDTSVFCCDWCSQMMVANALFQTDTNDLGAEND